MGALDAAAEAGICVEAMPTPTEACQHADEQMASIVAARAARGEEDAPAALPPAAPARGDPLCIERRRRRRDCEEADARVRHVRQRVAVSDAFLAWFVMFRRQALATAGRARRQRQRAELAASKARAAVRATPGQTKEQRDALRQRRAIAKRDAEARVAARHAAARGLQARRAAAEAFDSYVVLERAQVARVCGYADEVSRRAAAALDLAEAAQRARWRQSVGADAWASMWQQWRAGGCPGLIR